MSGRIILDLPPGENNPRNSEGAFIKLTDGIIMFNYSRFLGDKGRDDAAADIAAVYSYDNGESFGDMKILFTRNEQNAKNIMSVSALHLKDKKIAVFYCIRMGFHDTRSFMRISCDNGKTFDEGRYCINYPGYFVTNNDRVLILSNGRIIVPAAYHRCLGPDPISWESFDGKGVARYFYSDDSGKSFYESKGFGALNVPTDTGLQEPGIVELEPGKLMSWARTDLGFQYVSYSHDYGDNWEPFTKSDFSSPVSPMSIKRIPGKGAFIAVYNPLPTAKDKPVFGWGRTPLILRASQDGCKTFGDPIVIENDPERGYCYTAMHFTEDSLLLAYCAGGPKDKGCLNKLRIRKIPIADLISVN